MPQSELTLASLGDLTELSDRERLALAFGMLREQGWFAPIEWSTSLCCTSHGWQQVVEKFDMTAAQWMDTAFDDEPPTIWWHVQNDSAAFFGVPNEVPMSEAMEERIDEVFASLNEDEYAFAAWMNDHRDELEADELIERTTKLVSLVDDLSIHWSGGMERMHAAVELFRSVGLTVSEAANPNETIIVHPRHTPILVKVRTADGRLALWFSPEGDGPPLAVLSRSDALGLIDMIQQALGTPTAMEFPD